jgi:hypothetical protein
VTKATVQTSTPVRELCAAAISLREAADQCPDKSSWYSAEDFAHSLCDTDAPWAALMHPGLAEPTRGVAGGGRRRMGEVVRAVAGRIRCAVRLASCSRCRSCDQRWRVMTAPAVALRLAQAHEITDTSVIRIGNTDYPVAELDLFVTPSGACTLQFPGELARRTFLPHDIITLAGDIS